MVYRVKLLVLIVSISCIGPCLRAVDGESALALSEVTEELVFAPPGGIYRGNVELQLHSSNPGAIIRYTLDGRLPDSTADVYEATIRLEHTTAVRACLFAQGVVESPVVTHTYIIDDPCELPIVSLVTDPKNLWDEEIGIFAMGAGADPEYPHYGANFWQRWERPAHMEFFEPGGWPAVRMDLGIEVHGGISRAYPQKPLRVIARGRYSTSRIPYPIFADKAIQQFKRVVLRCSGNDWWRSMLRSALLHRAAKDSGLDWLAYRPARVYLNGDYWGLCNLRERPDSLYIDSNHDLHGVGIDLVGPSVKTIAGSSRHYRSMMQYVETHDLSDATHMDYVQSQMDVEKYALYYAFNILCGNFDWPGHNIRAWRAQTPTGIWRWILTDVDCSLGLWGIDFTHNTLEFALNAEHSEWPNPAQATLLMRKLLQNQDYRHRFINYLADLLNSRFLPSRMRMLLNSLARDIETEMPRHVARWDRPSDIWEVSLGELEEYIEKRPAYARSHILQRFDLSGTYTLSLDIDPPGSGRIVLAAVSVDSTWSGIYFMGVPVQLRAIPALGYAFASWSDPGLRSEPVVTITPNTSYSLAALFTPTDPLWADIMISEINYRSSPDFDTRDWIEVYNHGPTPVEISGWELRDGEDHTYRLPQGLVLPSKGYIVLCRRIDRFKELFSEVDFALGDLGFGLSSQGERISLMNSQGELIDWVDYGSQSPWPREADGEGPTLELIDPAADNSDPRSWVTLPGHGSPGRGPTRPLTVEISGPRHPYPNPMPGYTNIPIHLENGGKISIALYDIGGRRVGQVVYDDHPAGDHLLLWSLPKPSNGPISSGLYFLRIESDEFLRTEKLLVLWP